MTHLRDMLIKKILDWKKYYSNNLDQPRFRGAKYVIFYCHFGYGDISKMPKERQKEVYKLIDNFKLNDFDLESMTDEHLVEFFEHFIRNVYTQR